MKRTRILWAIALMFSVIAVQAQLRNDIEKWHGLRVSYDHVFMNVDVDDFVGMDGLNGTNLGYVYAFKLAKKIPLFIEVGVGVNFAQGIYNSEMPFSESGYEGVIKGKDKLTTLGMTVPVNLVYGFKLNNTLTLKPYTGFYLRANFMAKEKLKAQFVDSKGDVLVEETIEYNLFDQEDMEGNNNRWKPCQIGWQIGLTCDIKKFNIGVGYGIDFNEVLKNVKWGIFSARIGVNF